MADPRPPFFLLAVVSVAVFCAALPAAQAQPQQQASATVDDSNLPCGAFSDCARCTRNVNCGWCDSNSECMAGIVLEPNPGDWWCFDTAHVGVGDVTLLGSGGAGGGVYWMFYHGGNLETRRVGGADVKGAETRIGVALSQDGTHWSRVEGNHHTGALIDVGDADPAVPAGEDGSWDRLCMMRPCILTTGDGGGSSLRMYYHAVDEAGVSSIGTATSPDGFNWEKDRRVLGPGPPGAFDERGVSSCHVVRDGGRMVMLYEGTDAAGRTCIGAATSADGLGWERCAAPILEPSADAGAWDAGGVGSPFPVPMAEGRWRLYYEGRPAAPGAAAPAPCQGVGLAVSADGGLTQRFSRKKTC